MIILWEDEPSKPFKLEEIFKSLGMYILDYNSRNPPMGYNTSTMHFDKRIREYRFFQKLDGGSWTGSIPEENRNTLDPKNVVI